MFADNVFNKRLKVFGYPVSYLRHSKEPEDIKAALSELDGELLDTGYHQKRRFRRYAQKLRQLSY